MGDAIPEPLVAAGSAERGRALLVARAKANCALCHAIPDPAIPFAGNVGPSLAGVGARLSAGQIRLRVADNMRVNADTIMPSYYRSNGFDRVAQAYRNRTILSAQEVEDLVSYLVTLQ
ncbi:MAG: sulfur oxidation c-type cytochrome SoxX [Pseudomonadota bacterium]|nr:sulfur oxidation c-type cytochrome SoxX [Pseudomonadota bacterium]